MNGFEVDALDGLTVGVPEVHIEEGILGECPECGIEWTSESVAHCAECHLTFTSDTGFDAHQRTMKVYPGFRCLTPDQLRMKGYEPNEQGRWRRPIAEDARFWEKR